MLKGTIYGCMLSILMITISFAQDKYVVHLDLTEVVNDKIQVVVDLPAVDVDQIEYQMPKIVPGTYSIYDFGRFVSDFKAFDINGNQMITEAITPNRTMIYEAQKLSKITYWVDDTYDTSMSNIIFEPAGTDIEEGQVFVLNTFGFVGYLEGMKDLPYELKVSYPEYMFGASALNKEMLVAGHDLFRANDYFDLADGPIMYCRPDTTSVEIGGAKILVSVYSPNAVLKSDFVKQQIIPTMQSQKEYLGGILPIDNYAYLIYLTKGKTLSGGFGALEHSYSSYFILPEVNPALLGQSIRDIAAHEFFHILTPLNIHSEEIGNFDFINPKMSRHLWMYEGVTEYAAHLTQVKYGNLSVSEYLDVIKGQIKRSHQFNDTLPFTNMSMGCLDRYKDEYYNVYQKGALIGLCLDILLLDLSEGKYGLQQMMTDLAEEYGKDVPFKDEELFDKIQELTYPEVRVFFEKYVEGSTPIPYGEFFNMVGLEYSPGITKRELSLGHISFGVISDDNQLVINSIDHMNVFGQNMGYKEGDIIYKFDGVEIDIENYEEEFFAFKEKHVEGDKIEAVVLRKNKKGKLKKVKLTANAVSIDIKTDANLSVAYSAEKDKISLRNIWLNK